MNKESIKSFFYPKCIPCLIISLLVAVLIGIIILAGVIGGKTCDSLTVSLDPKVFCASETVADIDSDTDQLSIDIPPNAAITKIYVSVRRQPSDTALNNVTIAINENVTLDLLFITHFNVDEDDMIGSYESTLLHPLCVGPNGATIRVTSLDDNYFVTASDRIAITIVYCPDYCIE
jgi:hypothetical protein